MALADPLRSAETTAAFMIGIGFVRRNRYEIPPDLDRAGGVMIAMGKRRNPEGFAIMIMDVGPLLRWKALTRVEDSGPT